MISATGSPGSSANGGEITLSSTGGTIYFNNGASLNVSGDGSGQGGSVYFRSSLNAGGTDVNMNLDGAINGAKQIVAEGYQAYSYTGDYTIADGDIAGWQNSIQTFMNTYGTAIQTRLLSNLTLNGGSGSAGFNLVPGLEIDCTGNLTLNSNSPWDLSTWRFGLNSVPGMLTLRAGGDLLIEQNLTDAPTYMYNLLSTTAQPSWGMTLVAGADFKSANPTAVNVGAGNLTVGTADSGGVVVYSESGPIRLAAGNDVIVNSGELAGHARIHD